jgi:thymidylate synthase
MGGTWGLQAVYPLVLKRILEEGTERTARGMRTRELTPNVVTYGTDRGVPLIDRPGISTSFAAYEALWILAGQKALRGYEAWPEMKKYARVTDDGEGEFEGAYGPPVVEGLPHAVRLLRHEPHTRRCFLPIYRTHNLGGAVQALDVPCTLGYWFTVEADDAFTMTVNMRSSDAWVGFVYDTFVASTIAHVVCAAAGISPVGMQVRFIANSHHLYERNYEAAGRVTSALNVTYLAPPRRRELGVTLGKVRTAEAIAQKVLRGETALDDGGVDAYATLEEWAGHEDLFSDDPEFTFLLLACSRKVPGLKAWAGVAW